MENRKKLILISMLIGLLIVFCACGRDAEKPSTSPTKQKATTKITPEPTVEVTHTPSPTIDVNAKAPVADILDAIFNEDGTVENKVKNGPAITKVGTPNVVFDDSLNKYVASFDGGEEGANCHYMVPISEYYDELVNQFTLECYFKLNALPSQGYVTVLSNLEKGGFGFEIHANTESSAFCTAQVYVEGEYSALGTESEIGKDVYVHAILSFDSENFFLYINGELVETYKIYSYESLMMTTVESAQYLGIGADSSANQLGTAAIDGYVAVARLYSKAVNISEVNKLYGLVKGDSSKGE